MRRGSLTKGIVVARVDRDGRSSGSSNPRWGSGDSFELFWGPFRFHAVRSGRYQARVSFESVRNQYVDPDTRRPRTLRGVWLGSAQSNLVTLSIPP